MEKVVGEQDVALQQHFTQMSSKFSEISNSLMEGASNFGTLVFSICSLHFLHSISYNPKYKIFGANIWSRDPSCKGPIASTY